MRFLQDFARKHEKPDTRASFSCSRAQNMRNECSDPKFIEISRFRPQNRQISTPKPSLFWPKFWSNFDTFFVKFLTFFVKFCTFLALFYPPKKHAKSRVHENPKMNINIRPFSCQKKCPEFAPDPLVFVKICVFFVCVPETHKFHTFFALFFTLGVYIWERMIILDL